MSNAEYVKPFIPSSLVPEWDETAQEAHQRMAVRTLDSLLVEMPPTQVASIKDEYLRFAELPPLDEGDDGYLAITLPHGNPWSPSMYLRARLLQETAARDKTLIVFPNNFYGHRAYRLTREELGEVSQGSLQPIVGRQRRLLHTKPVGSVALFGESLGGMAAAAAGDEFADYFELTAVGIIEPPNIMDRDGGDLQKAFLYGGILKGMRESGRRLARAVDDSHIPALSEAKHRESTAPGWIKYFLSLKFIAENRALQQGMAANNLTDLLHSALLKQPGTPVLLARGEQSPITPRGSLMEHVYNLRGFHNGNIRYREVDGYGHELCDNLAVNALLGKIALAK